MKSFKRLFAFDHGLGNLPGHWVHFHRLLTDEARRLGLDVTLFGHQEIQPERVGDLPVKPLFTHGPSACFSPEIRENTRLRNEAFLADLDQLNPGDFGPDDLFVFTFVMNYELGGIMRFAQRFDSARAPVFLVLLQFDNGLSVVTDEEPDLPFIVRFDRALKKAFSGRSSEAALVGRLYRHALHSAGSPRGARVVFMAPSHGLDELFAAVLKRPIQPYCMLGPQRTSALADAGAHTPACENSGALVGFFGHSCVRKGLQLLPDIVATTRRTFPHTRFEIQVNYDASYPLKHLFDGLFDDELPGTVYTRGHLTTNDFYRALSRVDIVLCPYSEDVYRAMPSGLLSEALSMAKVVIVPSGTSLERHAKSVDAGARFFKGQTSEAVSLALESAIADLPQLQSRAVAAADRWRREHNPSQFMQQLLRGACAA